MAASTILSNKSNNNYSQAHYRGRNIGTMWTGLFDSCWIAETDCSKTAGQQAAIGLVRIGNSSASAFPQVLLHSSFFLAHPKTFFQDGYWESDPGLMKGI